MTEKKYTFPAKEHLKSRKEISRIFKNGIFLYSDYLSLGYTISENDNNTHKLAVSVPKKLFKSAVKRNKIKRRIKELFRLNKSNLYNFSEKSSVFFNIIIIYKHKEILSYQQIDREISVFLTTLINQG